MLLPTVSRVKMFHFNIVRLLWRFLVDHLVFALYHVRLRLYTVVLNGFRAFKKYA